VSRSDAERLRDILECIEAIEHRDLGRCGQCQPRVGMLAEEPHGEQEQVVEIDGRRFVEPALILGVDPGQACLVRADRLRGQLVGMLHPIMVGVRGGPGIREGPHTASGASPRSTRKEPDRG